jgi:hypothetical protein
MHLSHFKSQEVRRSGNVFHWLFPEMEKEKQKLGMVVNICNPSTQEAESGLRVQGQPVLHRETLFCFKQNKTNNYSKNHTQRKLRLKNLYYSIIHKC